MNWQKLLFNFSFYFFRIKTPNPFIAGFGVFIFFEKVLFYKSFSS